MVDVAVQPENRRDEDAGERNLIVRGTFGDFGAGLVFPGAGPSEAALSGAESATAAAVLSEAP